MWQPRMWKSMVCQVCQEKTFYKILKILVMASSKKSSEGDDLMLQAEKQ